MLTIHRPVTIEDPEQSFATALFDVAITSRLRNGRLEPILRLSLRQARKRGERWEIIGEPVARAYPNIEALLADLPEATRPKVQEVWDSLETIVQAINDKHYLV